MVWTLIRIELNKMFRGPVHILFGGAALILGSNHHLCL